MSKKKKWINVASLATLVLTVVLFIVAIFEKGMTHDLLLEAGVFLISIKLVLSTQKSETLLKSLQEQLDSIERKLDR
jgi:hypothetical protein